MAKPKYFAGIGIASAAFLFLIFRELTNKTISAGVVGFAIAGVIVGGCLLIAFSEDLKRPSSLSQNRH